MIVAGLVLGALAALLHVYIFFLESIAWTSPAALKTFGLRREQAEATKELAFNQGFYNLFLAIIAALGIALACLPSLATVGYGLVLAGVGSMLAAALVLFCSSPYKRPAAVKQGALPLLSVIVLVIGMVLEGA